MGLATFTPNDEPQTVRCGSPGYVAPEILYNRQYSYKADIFSLGATFFNLITGLYLFSGKTAMQVMQANAECDIRGRLSKYLTRSTILCQDLMKRMLTKDPAMRISTGEALLHPWFLRDKVIINELVNLNDIMC